MHYPDIDPIIVSLGPVALRWYGLAYLAGFVAVWALGRLRVKRGLADWTQDNISDMVFFGALGAVLGGRVGYCLFYAFDKVLNDPLFVFRMWEGGMSFHGGLAGAMVGLWLFARKSNRPFFEVGDFITPTAPIGLGLGRLANFVNGELPGRATDGPFGLIYPCHGAVLELNATCVGAWESFARHPSPLYQAFTDGLVLFVVVWWFASKHRPTGAISGVFLAAYGIMRFVTENFREPDQHIGYLAFGWLTMGQVLSLPMVIVGIVVCVWAYRSKPGKRPVKTT